MFQGHQLGRVLVQNIWKVLAAFGLGIVAVVGGGLILSNVHTISQPAPAQRKDVSQSFEKLDSRTGKIYREDSQPAQVPIDGTNPNFLPGGEPFNGDTAGLQAAAQNIPGRRVRRKRGAGNAMAAVSSDTRGPVAAPPPTVASPLTPQAVPGQLASAPLPLAASALMIAAETPVSVRLTQQLSSKANHKGEEFKGTLAAPLRAQGIVVAEAGAAVTGRVVDARSPRFFRGGSNLNLELTQVRMSDGRLVAIKTTQWFDTGAHSRVAKAAIVPAEAAKKAASGIKSDGEGGADSPQRTVAAEAADTSDKGDRKGSAVVLPPGSEIVFRLLQPLTINANQEHR